MLAVIRVVFRNTLPLRVRPERWRPALSLPGHTAAQEARCSALRNALMSTPISAMMLTAPIQSIPGMLISWCTCW